MFPNESLDFVFIDAGHMYEEVKEDISLWLPKVKPGGVISGHDYSNKWPGVAAAVNEMFGKPTEIHGTIWVIRL